MEKSQEISRQRSAQMFQLLIFAQFHQNFNAGRCVFRKQRDLTNPLYRLNFLSNSQSFFPKLKFMFLNFLQKSWCSLASHNSKRNRCPVEIAGQSRCKKLREEVSVLDRNDLDKPGQTEQTLPLEQRIVIFLPHLPHNSLHKGFNVKTASLIRLKYYHIFRKPSQHQQSRVNFMPGLPRHLQLRPNVNPTQFCQVDQLSLWLI